MKPLWRLGSSMQSVTWLGGRGGGAVPHVSHSAGECVGVRETTCSQGVTATGARPASLLAPAAPDPR